MEMEHLPQCCTIYKSTIIDCGCATLMSASKNVNDANTDIVIYLDHKFFYPKQI